MARISEEQAGQYSNNLNGEWFQLKNDQDVARVQFMFDSIDELEIFACHKVKVGDKERYVDCKRTYDEPIDNCPFCAAGIPVKPVRFVIMFQHDDQKVKIWERGKTFISKLQGLMNRYNPLSDYVFDVERHGVAGDKDTKYELYPMDRVEPFNLDEVEYPELLGGLILDKTVEEMQIYLDTGSFPPTAEEEANNASHPQQSSMPARRAAVSRQSAPPATGGRSTPPVTGSRATPPSTGSRASTPPATGGRATPPASTPPAGISRRGAAPSGQPASRSSRFQGGRETF
jgi:hypothetical protein